MTDDASTEATGAEPGHFATRLEALSTLIPEFVVVYSPQATVQWVSTSAATYLGYTVEQLRGAKSSLFVHPEDSDNLASLVRKELKLGTAPAGPLDFRPTVTARIKSASGAWRWVETTYVIAVVSGETEIITTSRDVHERQLAMERLEARALVDHLTGVANRHALVSRMESLLAHGIPCTILFCDLDGFKAINDQYGHHVGDDTLRVIALRIRDAVRVDDLVARMGGDEFVIVLEHTMPGEADEIASRIAAAVREPIGDRRLEVSTSIGISHSSTSGQASDWIAAADAAMYQAKADRRRMKVNQE
jgi:diguanylate cyclase (GGDEF)-like protein/PAS domain S-box-containing protein